MHIAVVHGYLLAGTGSNQYVNDLCRTLARRGHDVSLFCQEQHPERHDYIGAFETFLPGNTTSEVVFRRPTRHSGEVTVLRPYLAGELPVYVHDEYDHLTARALTDMSEPEIERYLDRNARAIAAHLSEKPAQLIISNHLILQPVYVHRALHSAGRPGTRHLMVVHGSSFNYSVRESELLQRYARWAIRASHRCIFVSSHSRNQFLQFFASVPGLADKCRVIPPGVDSRGFRPRKAGNCRYDWISALKSELDNQSSTDGERAHADQMKYLPRLADTLERADDRKFRRQAERIRQRFGSWLPDRDAADRLRRINWDADDVILYFGKYLWGKGIQVLIAAAPLILRHRPRAQFVLVGFGSSRELLETMVYCLDAGRRRAYRRLARRSAALDPDGGGRPGPALQGLLRRMETGELGDGYFHSAADRLLNRTTFTGIMNHRQLQLLVPRADVVVAPSIFPEAFGLVAVEALASGVIPFLTRHSGFRDTISLYTREFADLDPAGHLRRLRVDADLVPALADNVTRLLQIYEGMTGGERAKIRHRAHALARDHFSWDEVARRLTRA